MSSSDCHRALCNASKLVEGLRRDECGRLSGIQGAVRRPSVISCSALLEVGRDTRPH